MYDPGAMAGERRFWPNEEDQPQFKTHCRFCDKPVGEATTTLQGQLASLVGDPSQTIGTVTMQFV
jgi:hypothetical protein